MDDFDKELNEVYNVLADACHGHTIGPCINAAMSLIDHMARSSNGAAEVAQALRELADTLEALPQ